MRRLLPLLTVACCLPLTGCPTSPTCTTEAALSVLVTVVDDAGADVPEVEVFYDAGDGEQACEDFSDGTFGCGWEVDGDITVTARADGFSDATDVVTVGADECHVIQESLTLTMAPIVPAPFDEIRVYVHQLFDSQEDCEEAQAAGVNCIQTVEFCPDGTASMIGTDIINAGEYGVVGDTIETTWGSGDVPGELSFTIVSDDELLDGAWGLDWIRSDEAIDQITGCP